MITRGEWYGKGSNIRYILLISSYSLVDGHSTNSLSRGFSQEPIPPGRKFLVIAFQAYALFEILNLE